MGQSVQARENSASETDRTEDRDTEQLFGSVIGDVAKLLWPECTAPCLADEIGCSVRMAEMYLAGDRKWSGDAVAVIVTEILSRHKMRNVKVIASR